MGVELRERWGRQPVWARWALAVYLMGFLVGTRTHVLDVARDGVHAYAMFPQVPLQVFFVSLVVLDPLVILLVGLAWREGIWLAGAVMVQVFDPDTGIATVTDPQGNTERVDLHDLNSRGGAGASDVLDGLGDLESLGGLKDTGGGDGITPRDVSLGLNGDGLSGHGGRR